MDYVIELNNIVKEYPGQMALNNISLNVRKGSIHGFLGPNGAGKTTTMKIITGIIAANAGKVLINGIGLNQKNGQTKSVIGYLPENPPLYENMRVINYLKFVARIHDVKSRQVDDNTSFVINKCGLHDVCNRLIGNLSKGYKQRVGIAQALVHRPPIIILDEPTIGLDPTAMAEIRELILSLKKEHTVLLSTHLLHEASLTCSDITIINQGKIVKSGSIDEIRRDFQGHQVIVTELLNWSEDKKRKVEESLSCEVKKTGTNELKFFFKSSQDMRPSLSTQLSNLNCDLVSFREEQLQLEDIFKLVTLPASKGEGRSEIS